ncbi:hypothetical protein ETD83_27715 [Actinomadura soli]|uniref:Mercuric ion transport protein n=1 Tax=Actinomadura soli TaxID=2508997 RepID=A0A5C4J689_9ACTN|nr:hypothetical protein [Actinomadura soli]TMQ92216.1 hypothetical protein ETD83_27715 [Actinomadura soli]
MKIASRAGTGFGTLAAVACVACCALPVLIAAGVLSGGAAAFLADRMPLVAVGLTVLAVAAFAVAARRRTGARGCGSKASGCGCSTTRV